MSVKSANVELSDSVECPSCSWSGSAGRADLYDEYVKCPECGALVVRPS